MKDSKTIQADIDDLQASVAPALLEIKKLDQELSEALSREFDEIKIGVLRAKAPGRIEHVPVNFWHAANLAFTDKERDSFNAWKTEIYDASDKLRCACIYIPDEWSGRFSYYIDKSRELHKIICAIPFLSPD